ncbi:MAG: hypothetical protein H0W01_08675 [Pseudonocardiales bacterium]|nr:hypothetical protein [Pseudonocardiales bacterium]
MLEATKTSIWRNRYDISADGQRLATWDGSLWKAGGSFQLDGKRYEIRGNMWGNKYGMVDDAGNPVASAEHVGRKHWTVEADGRTYEFQRPSIWRREEELHADGRRVGSVRRPSVWRGDTVADLPGLPLPVQIFVLAVVLTMWDWSDASAAGAAAAGGAATAGGSS